jgi:cellulose synthase/poly-beta-1,6-N-acetylglucosamine synthase-like glycosyltransferase
MIWFISLFYKKNELPSIFDLPFVSIIISAYNEERVIISRIENIAIQNYDFNRLEVIIGSDCSSDNTNEILYSLSEKYSWLSVYTFDERRGKAAVLNDLVKKANGSIIIFSDANTEFERNAVHNLVKEFTGPNIGGVSGKLELVEPLTYFEKSSQEKKYWEYEIHIKKLEGKIGLLIGANGGIFAIRKELFETIPINMAVTDDLFITLSVLKRRYKFLYTFNASAKENTANDLKTEFKRKIRFAATNFQTLGFFRDLLFSKNVILSFSLWSHKVIRWITPFILILILIINLVLFNHNDIYQFTLYFQLVIYIIAFVGYLASRINLRIPIASIIFYFIYSNLAIIIGFYRYMNGSHSGIWKPTSR